MSYTIAVDCDEVLIESLRNLSAFVQEKYSRTWEFNDFRYYLISKNPHVGLTDQQAIALFDEYFQSEFAKNALPVAGAYEVLTEWKRAGHNLVVVTARNHLAEQLTRYQIQTHYPDIFTDVYFAQHYTDNHIPKSAICKQLGARLLVEDNIDYALEVAEHALQSILLAKPRNNWREDTNPHMLKVNNRSDINPLFPESIFIQS